MNTSLFFKFLADNYFERKIIHTSNKNPNITNACIVETTQQTQRYTDIANREKKVPDVVPSILSFAFLEKKQPYF